MTNLSKTLGGCLSKLDLHFRPQSCIMCTMCRKILTAALILIYGVTVPTLLVVHTHPLGFGSGNTIISARDSVTPPPNSSLSQSASCQICSRLASMNLFQINCEQFAAEQYRHYTPLFEAPTLPCPSVYTFQLRAPPTGPVA